MTLVQQCLTRWLPVNPVPPVTKTLMSLPSPVTAIVIVAN